MDPVDAEIAKTQEERKIMEAALAPNSITFDTELYDGSNRFEDYNREIPANDEEENADAMDNEVARKLASYTAPRSLLNEMPRGGDDDESTGFPKSQKIIDREDEYRRRRLNQVISPERHDAFANGDKTPKPETRSYADIMREAALKREKEETLKVIARRKKEEEENKAAGKEKEREQQQQPQAQPSQKRRNRWDQNQEKPDGKKAKTGLDWDIPEDGMSTPGRWDATPTPGRMGDALSRKNRWDETPTPGRTGADSDSTPAGGGATPAGMAWDATPKLSGLATPTPKRQRSRWDETPATMGSATPGATPGGGAAYTPGVTPVGGVELATPTPGAINLRGAITPEQYNLLEMEISLRGLIERCLIFDQSQNRRIKKRSLLSSCVYSTEPRKEKKRKKWRQKERTIEREGEIESGRERESHRDGRCREEERPRKRVTARQRAAAPLAAAAAFLATENHRERRWW